MNTSLYLPNRFGRRVPSLPTDWIVVDPRSPLDCFLMEKHPFRVCVAVRKDTNDYQYALGILKVMTEIKQKPLGCYRMIEYIGDNIHDIPYRELIETLNGTSNDKAE